MFFAEKIYQLRRKEKMTQEEFAELFDVSRQAVQKWENGTSLPELQKVVEISKHFGVSVDFLVLGRQSRAVEELTAKNEVLPSFENIPEWEFYASAIMHEYRQSVDEGLDIEQYKMLFEAAARLPQNSVKKELGDVIYKIVRNAPLKKDFAYREPSQLFEIKDLRNDYDLPKGEISNLKDKITGAWTGRICGCMLGKTVECISSDELKRFLSETGNYPMTRYIRKTDLEKVDLSKYDYGFASRDYADAVECMPVDDDTNYTVMAQLIFEEYGVDFTPENIASAWIKYQGKNSYCTAERVAYCNFVKGYMSPYSAIYKNPYREWIGAQIRADYWGYINPGNPERAAEMAWRDASISHVKNGIYGEMFVAAMIATAAQTADTEKIILSGLAQIPRTSRLYEDIMQIMDIYKSGKTQKEAFAHIRNRFNDKDGYDWCHTNSNAMIVAASLLYGKGDFGKSICMAVETGFDTDCNGATVGSILGMANGIASIGEEWIKPFNDTLDTSVFGVGKVNISERVDMTMRHIEKNSLE